MRGNERRAWLLEFSKRGVGKVTRARHGAGLQGVSFRVEPREKVGIVGRTGSGKSSLIVALFRMVEPFQGQIVLDGINLLTLGLQDVRGRIAAIPQVPSPPSVLAIPYIYAFGNSLHLRIWQFFTLTHLVAGLERP